MLWERIFVFFSEAGSSTSTSREESARRGSGLGEPLSISLWCSRLYCVSPLCAILCIDVGLRVLCDAQLDILGIAACPVTSPTSHPTLHSGPAKLDPDQGAVQCPDPGCTPWARCPVQNDRTLTPCLDLGQIRELM